MADTNSATDNHDLWDAKLICSMYPSNASSSSPLIYSFTFHWSHQLCTGLSHCHPSGHPFIRYNSTTSLAFIGVAAVLDVTAPVITLSPWRAHALWWQWRNAVSDCNKTVIRSQRSCVAGATVSMDFYYTWQLLLSFTDCEIQVNRYENIRQK